MSRIIYPRKEEFRTLDTILKMDVETYKKGEKFELLVEKKCGFLRQVRREHDGAIWILPMWKFNPDMSQFMILNDSKLYKLLMD